MQTRATSTVSNRRFTARAMAALLVTTAFSPAIVHAQSVWTGAIDNDPNNPGNWSPAGVPSQVSTVIINSTTNAPIVDSGKTLSGNEVRIGSDGAATLTVRSGGSVTATNAVVGGALDGNTNPTGNGTLLISGAGTQVSARRLAAGFGDGTRGTIRVTDGALLTSGSGEIGNRNSTGIVTISGAGSRWNVEGPTTGGVNSSVRLGTGVTDNSRGSLEILDGGVMSLGANVVLQVSQGSDLRVSGTNSRITGVASSALELERSTTGGRVVIENGGVVSVGSASFGTTSELTIKSGARLEVAGGSTNFNQNARVLVSGAGSRLTTGGNFNFFANGVGTDIVFDDGAIVTSTANVGSSLAFMGSRRLIVSNGAQFNLTGGSDASLTLNGGILEVTDASVSLSGDLVFNGTSSATLRNSNFSANNVALLGANSRLIVGADVGQATAGIGGVNFGGRITITQPTAALVLNYTGSGLTIGSRFDGTGGRFVHLAGDTRLTGMSNGWRGITDLTGGSLAVDNLFGDNTGDTTAMNVSGGAILSGRGMIGGVVTVSDGIIRPGGDPLTTSTRQLIAMAGGNTIGTLTFTGQLNLGAASRLEYQFGAPSGAAGVASDLINVGGNLTLDGTLNVINAGGFGAGLYRLINYGGTLTNNGLQIGAVPTGFAASDLTVQTSVAQQINLLVGSGLSGNFWDGSDTTGNGVVDGGTGRWTAGGTNWTNAAGTVNGRYSSNAMVIFAGTGGVVTVDNGTAPGIDNPQITLFDTDPLAPKGMQFASTGYRIEGGDISFGGGTGIATIRIGDGTAGGAGINATIASNLILANRIDKTDLGTLTLTGQNLMLPGGGRSRVQSGTLEIAGGGQLSTGGLEIALLGQAATFRVTGAGSIASVGSGIRTGFINNGPGTVEVLGGGTLRDSARGGNDFGAGSLLRVSGAGSILDLANNSVSQGSFLVENGGIARAAPFAFTSTGSLILRSGGRIERTLGDGSFGSGTWRIPNGLIQGAGTAFSSTFALSIAPATSSDPGARFVVEDGATVTVNANTDSGLGFEGPISTLDVRSGASFTLTGGSGAGLQIENSRLTVDNATFTIGGALLGGQRFGNNTVFLRNADFTARQIELRAATDRIVIGGDAGEAATGAGRFNVGQVSLGNAAISLILNHNTSGFTIGSEFQGAGVIRHLAGDTRLTGSSQSWGGTTQLTGGSLAVDGVLGSAAHSMSVSGGGGLSGRGTIGGSVTVADGIIRPGGDLLTATGALLGGNAIGALTIGGALTLGAMSRLDYQLGAPTGVAGVASDLINVGGNLVLDGTLNIFDAGGFGAGLYRLINYGGTLTDNGLGLGMVPMGFGPADLTIQTSVANQVNLLVSMPVRNFNFWDGSNTTANNSVNGGTGTWSATGNNWTVMDGSRNGVYDPAALLIFAGTEGSVTVDNGAGPVFLGTGAQFATNGYRVAGGALRLDAPSTTLRVGDGTAAGAGITATIDSVLSGTGGLNKTDLGTLVLTGANTYSGGTTVTGGVLRGTTVSVACAVALGAAGTLQFDQSTDGTYAGTLTGNGMVRKTSTGTLSITGTSAAFAGATRIEAGTLAAIGTLGGNVVVQSAATLVGNGRVGALDVSGRVAPTGVGTLNVTGDVIFRPGSTFAVDLLAAGGADRIAAGGRATLEGGTVVVTALDPQVSYTDGSVFRILDAVGGRTGTFAGLTEQSEFLDFVLGHDATGASITISQVRTFPDIAASYNQRQAAGALKTLVRPAGSDALAVYNAILMLNGDAARASFDASSGEIYASLISARQRQGMALAGQFILRGQAGLDEGLGVWGGVTGNNGHVAGDGNGARFTSDAFGGEIGVDYHGPGNGWAAGIGGGWLNGDVSINARRSNASVDAWHIGGYVRYGTGAEGFTATASLVHARADADVTRSIAFGPITRIAQSDSDIDTTTIAADLRYGIADGNWAFGPTIAVEASKARLGAFRETGANALDLFAGRNSDAWTRAGAGGFVRYASQKGYFDLTTRYVSGERNDADVNLGMTESDTTFNVRAPTGARSGVALQASGRYDLGSNWSIAGQMGATGGSGDAGVDGNLRLSLAF